MGDMSGVDITGRRVSEGTLELIAYIDRCNAELPERVTGEPTYEAIKRLRESRDTLRGRENKSTELYCEKCGGLLGIQSYGHTLAQLHEAMMLAVDRGDEITRLKRDVGFLRGLAGAINDPENEALVKKYLLPGERAFDGLVRADAEILRLTCELAQKVGKIDGMELGATYLRREIRRLQGEAAISRGISAGNRGDKEKP